MVLAARVMPCTSVVLVVQDRASVGACCISCCCVCGHWSRVYCGRSFMYACLRFWKLSWIGVLVVVDRYSV